MVKLSKEDLDRLKKNPKDKKFWGEVQDAYDFKESYSDYMEFRENMEAQFMEDFKHSNERIIRSR